MEKEKRFLVIILAFLLFRVWFIAPYLSTIEANQNEYISLARSLSKAQLLMDSTDKLKMSARQVEAVDAENASYLIAVDIKSKEALSSMQKSLRGFMEEKGVEVESMTWGEPYQEEGTEYVRLSLSFVASTQPSDLHRFLEAIAGYKPLLLFDSLTITPKRDALRVTGQVIGFVRQSVEQ